MMLIVKIMAASLGVFGSILLFLFVHFISEPRLLSSRLWPRLLLSRRERGQLGLLTSLLRKVPTVVSNRNSRFIGSKTCTLSTRPRNQTEILTLDFSNPLDITS